MSLEYVRLYLTTLGLCYTEFVGQCGADRFMLFLELNLFKPRLVAKRSGFFFA